MCLTLYFQSSLKMTFGAKITIFTLKKRCAEFQEKGKSYKKEKNLNRQFGFLHFELQLKHEIAETFHHKVVFKFCQNIPARKEMKCGGQKTTKLQTVSSRSTNFYYKVR